ncbi:MAG: hypothetical protein QY317_16475 [Candidatus Jettenia caeni]|nr:MAG: hypothetical protein QY317_16475 [Candidatus Jettenia caeni]
MQVILALLIIAIVSTIIIYVIVTYNNLASKRAKIFETINNIGAFKERRRRVLKDSVKYTARSTKHEQKIVKTAVKRGR